MELVVAALGPVLAEAFGKKFFSPNLTLKQYIFLRYVLCSFELLAAALGPHLVLAAALGQEIVLT